MTKNGSDTSSASLTTSGSSAGDEDLRIDSEGNTLLHLAAKRGDLAEVKRLCAKDLHVTSVNHEEYTPFHFAVLGGSKEVVEWMLDTYPEVINQQTAYHYTVLHLVAQRCDLGLMIYLLEHKADPSLATNGSNTPLDILLNKYPEDTALQTLAHQDCYSSADLIGALNGIIESESWL